MGHNPVIPCHEINDQIWHPMSWPTPYQKTFNMNFLKEVPLSEPEMSTDPEEGYQSCYKIQQCTQKEITLNNHGLYSNRKKSSFKTR